MHLGKCGPPHCNKGSYDEKGDEDGFNFIRCPHGQVYCLELGFCSSNCKLLFPNVDNYNNADIFGFQCPPETVFCLKTGTCSGKCHNKREANDQPRALWRDADQDNAPFNLDGCPRGKQYCHKIDACADSCDLFRDPVDIEGHFVIVCKDGFVRSTF